MSNVRQKAKDLIELAHDESTTDKERVAAALNAAKLIRKHGLLDSPLDGMLDNNETVQAAKSIVDIIFDPELRRNAKKVRDGISSGIRRRRR